MNDIDALMSLDPTSLSDADIDAIIAYHRRIRQMKAQGIKPVASGPQRDLSALIASMPRAAPVITPATPGKRRF